MLRKLVGAAGSARLTLPTRQIGRMALNFTGILPALPANVAAPAAATYDSTRPPPLISVDVYLGQAALKLREVSIDFGAVVQQSDNPAAAYGFGVAGQTSRRTVGEINPLLELLSTRDAMSDFTTGVERALWYRWGATAGNRVSILCPAIRQTGATPGDTDGFAHDAVPFEAVGIDSGLYLSFS